MENAPAISIIIPIFNVDPFLCQCIDSIGMLGREDVEIILVNDGSKDCSSEICKEYDKNWNNIILIEKHNGGLSDARNVGTNVAHGNYIYYLDSDDWLAPGAIEQLYWYAIEKDCDIVQGGFYYAYNDHLEYDNRWFEMECEPFILDRNKAMHELIKNQFIKNFAWGKLYKGSIVRSHPFPVGKFFEDSYWQHLVVNDCSRYGVLPKPLYYYRQRKGSISGTPSIQLLDLLEGMENRLSFIIDNYPEYTSEMAELFWKQSFTMSRNGIDFKVFFKRINDQYESLLGDSFKKCLFYKLVSTDSIWLQLYLLFDRINRRLFSKKLESIKI